MHYTSDIRTGIRVARDAAVTCCCSGVVAVGRRCCSAAKISGGMEPGRWINIGNPLGDTAATADWMPPATSHHRHTSVQLGSDGLSLSPLQAIVLLQLNYCTSY